MKVGGGTHKSPAAKWWAVSVRSTPVAGYTKRWRVEWGEGGGWGVALNYAQSIKCFRLSSPGHADVIHQETNGWPSSLAAALTTACGGKGRPQANQFN